MPDADLELGTQSRPTRPPTGAQRTQRVKASLVGPRLDFLFLNARRLVSRIEKGLGLAELMRKRKWPSLVAVTETNGHSGTSDISDFLSLLQSHSDGSDILARYEPLWSSRTTSLCGGAISASKISGGGILLLVKKSLGARVLPSAVFNGAGHQQRKDLDGHLYTWVLQPLPAAAGGAPRGLLNCKVAVTVCYAPPVDAAGWGNRTREPIFAALKATIASVKASPDTFHCMMTHLNSQDGGCDVTLPGSALPLPQLQSIIEQRAPLCQFGRLDASHGALVLRRARSVSTADVSVGGVELTRDIATLGMCPLSGVFNHRHPSSRLLCIKCKPKCTKAKCPRPWGLRRVHDEIWLPNSTVVDAVLAPRKRREAVHVVTRWCDWSAIGGIDHGITFGHFCLPRPSTRARRPPPPAAAHPRRQGRRARLPDDLIERGRAEARIGRHVHADLERQDFTLLKSRNAEDLNRCLVDAIRAATAAESAPADDDDGASATDLARSKSNDKQLQQVVKKLGQLLARRHARRAGGAMGYGESQLRTEIIAAERAVRRLRGSKKRFACKRLADAITMFASRGPRRAWRDLKRAGTAMGLPAEPRCPLLERLHDEQGAVITDDAEQIRKKMRDDREQIFRVSAELGSGCERSLADALASLSLLNGDIRLAIATIDAASAAARSAADPLDPTRAWQRGPLAFDPADAQGTARATAAQASVAALRQRLAAECAELEGDLMLSELSIIDGMADVGAGVDNALPAALRRTTDETRELILALLAMVWNTGVAPADWQDNRCVLHYKKKDSDVYCLDNYRGLGIGALMCKVLSLIMMKRLEKFVASTGALSPNQGGFLQRRGCPEQVFTCSEAVRAALKADPTRPVYICFIDIQRAYDTVLHPLLWSRCAAKGIGGRFLTTLQAMYSGLKSSIDVASVLLDAVSNESSVLQGNPLSCLLFNIYIDGAIRKLDEAGEQRRAGGGAPFGVPLPRVAARGSTQTAAATGSWTQDDFMASLFFADDGALFARDMATMQAMLDILRAELLDGGLVIKVSKTHLLIVPALSSSQAVYDAHKLAATATPDELKADREPPKPDDKRMYSKLTLGDQRVDIVDTFDYLGVRLSWQWDWRMAWKMAQSRAWASFHIVVASGFYEKGASMASQLMYARAIVMSHLDYISAVAGVGRAQIGSCKTSPLAENERITTSVLKSIADLSYANEFVLRGEAGVWDQRSRVDKLVLRFWAKLVACPIDSTHYRAMCLSISSLTPAQRADPHTCDQSPSKLCRQPWAQQLLAAAADFGIPAACVDSCSPDLVALHQFDPGAGAWIAVSGAQPAAPGRLLRLVSASVGPPYAPAPSAYQHGSDAWLLPHGTSAADALECWGAELKAASYASLQTRGNHHRQRVFSAWLADPNGVYRSSTTYKNASYMEPYWFLSDCTAARRLLRARHGLWGCEDNQRCRGQNKTTTTIELDRLFAHQRACYLCPAIAGTDDCFLPETLEHVLLRCTCPALSVARASIAAQLTQIAADAAASGLRAAAPNFGNDAALMAVLQLATSIGPHHARVDAAPAAAPPPAPPAAPASHATRSVSLAAAAAAHRVADAVRRAPQLVHDMPAARVAAAWVSALASDWRRRMGDPTTPVPSLTPGLRLAAAVAAHSQRMYSLRRKHLRDVDGFATRARDPPAHLRPSATAAPLPL
jgi:hypothetical protein